MKNIGEAFLHQKNSKLFKEKKVENLQKYKKIKGEKISKNPADKLADWLKHIEKTHLGHDGDEAYINRLKRYYYKKHIIKEDEVPESYYETQKRFAKERGHGNIELNEMQKKELAGIIIKDQKASFDNWFNYFISEDSKSFPIWAKYWAFDGMLKLGTYHKNKKKFSRRNKETVAPFADLNREALAYVMDLLVKKVGKEDIADLENNKELQKLLAGANFAKLYSYAIEKVTPTEKHEMEITEGEWRKFEQGSDHMPLVNSLQGHGTGWCTAGEMTAKSQLDGGDFYVYYSKNKDGEAVNPRIAIRMQGNTIAEVRGVADNQEMDDVIKNTKIVQEKLQDFADVEDYMKHEKDMKLLTEIERKNSLNTKLSKKELRFLYELDRKIIGVRYGYGFFSGLQKEDPRIKDIINSRNIKTDLSVATGYTEEEISLNNKEFLNGKNKIKFHYGDLILNTLKLDEDVKDIVWPDKIRGALILGNLESAEDLLFSVEINGKFYMPRLKSVNNLILPKGISHSISGVTLSSLESANELIFPKEMNGGISLDNLKTVNKLIFPELIQMPRGLGLHLPSLESANELVFPKKIDAHIGLQSLQLVNKLIFPEQMRKLLLLNSLESIEGLDLSIKGLEKVYLFNLSLKDQNYLKKKYPHIKFYFKEED